MDIFAFNEMFVIALVAISIVGLVCVGLLILLAVFALRRRDESPQPPPAAVGTTAPTPPTTTQPANQDVIARLEKVDKETRFGTSIAMWGISLAVITFSSDILRTNLLRGLVGIVLGVVVFWMGTRKGRKWIEDDINRAKNILNISLAILVILLFVSVIYVKGI